jgi:hypothetical protein
MKKLILVLAIFCLSACTSSDSTPPPLKSYLTNKKTIVTDVNDRAATLQWINKSAKVLRSGRGLDSHDDTKALLKMTRREILEKFMTEARFGDMVLDFNLFFLGLKKADLRLPDGSYRPKILEESMAPMNAAREVVSGGDYLKLLDYDQPVFVLPLEDRSKGLDPNFSGDPEEFRAKQLKNFQDGIDKAVKITDEDPKWATTRREEICSAVSDGAVLGLYYYGLPFQFYRTILESNDWFFPIYLPCRLGGVTSSDLPANTPEILKRLKTQAEDLIPYMKSLHPSAYSATTVTGVREAPAEKLKLREAQVPFLRDMYNNIPNSSTNFNRRRAAFVLKRYFCDDLTPIDVVIDPAKHADGRHASEKSCLACHYKLDPMAGFFKNIGFGGFDFSQSPVLLTDDQVLFNREKYQANWKGGPKSNNEWNIGYIRSTNFPEKNEFGQDLKDLFGIIRKAPEAKRCIVKRLTEYVLGAGQTIDAGYMEYLTAQFEKEAAANSSKAFKELLIRVLGSQTFDQGDVDQSQCYDYAPGESPEGRPPCKVAHTFSKNCAQCHGPSAAAGGLDLTQWVKTADGTMGFKHVKNQNQLSSKASLGVILERLTTTDTDRRMPLAKFMNHQDLEELVLWTQQNLGQVQK